MPALRTLQVRVKRGAEYLDKEWPNWATEIDQDKLNLRQACNCTLGQLYGNYWKPGSGAITVVGSVENSIRLGFNASTSGNTIQENDRQFITLQRLWLHQTKKRLAA